MPFCTWINHDPGATNAYRYFQSFPGQVRKSIRHLRTGTAAAAAIAGASPSDHAIPSRTEESSYFTSGRGRSREVSAVASAPSRSTPGTPRAYVPQIIPAPAVSSGEGFY